MRRPRFAVLVPLALLAIVGITASAVPASGQAQDLAQRVIVVQVDGPIDGIVVDYLLAGLADAEREGAVLVVQIDSPGTLGRDAVALAERFHAASIPVVVWAGPAPATIAGGALLLLQASSLGAVAPGAAVGPAVPIDVARPGAGPTAAEVGDLVAGWAADRGRPTPTLVPDRAVPAQDAVDGGIVAVAASSVTDLMAAIDGMTVETAAGPWTFATRVATAEGERPVEVRFTSLGPADRVLHAAATPTSVYLLLVLGLAALAFELTQPGFGFAGFSGIALAGLGAWGLTVVPSSPLGLALLLMGNAALVGDVVLRRLGPLTIGGIVGFLAGSVLAFGDVDPAIRISSWLIGAMVISAGLYYGFVLTVALQSRDRITSTQRGLVGLRGEARSDLAPEGGVYVKGTMWRGRAAGDHITSGTRIRVRGLDGLVLVVEADPTGGADGDDGGVDEGERDDGGAGGDA